MAFKTLLSLVSLVTFASAHFSISYPEPRGVFVSADEVKFCDGYTNAANNRSDFPLSNGFIKLDNHHSEWTASVLISIDQNPTDFAAFNTSSSGVQLPLAVNFFSSRGAGEICIPVDVASLSIPGVSDGSNVTLQAMFAGADGNLFQCVDVTLRANASIPSDVTCTRTVNGTVDTAPSSTSTSATSTDTSG
ncbi:uncharacterized protein FOMMEDRAFT_33917, partial [Fomitiporia mediterranea MF3/22]|uniref:uncharacterized protein n=1 Tax=Fomitiporia mediterranea (strain MF3/22) TaxID=694068 RepID=UPI0004409A36